MNKYTYKIEKQNDKYIFYVIRNGKALDLPSEVFDSKQICKKWAIQSISFYNKYTTHDS